jgi:hypothetical protein
MDPYLATTNVTDSSSLITASGDLVTNNVAAIGAAAVVLGGLGFAFAWFTRLRKRGAS